MFLAALGGVERKSGAEQDYKGDEPKPRRDRDILQKIFPNCSTSANEFAQKKSRAFAPHAM